MSMCPCHVHMPCAWTCNIYMRMWHGAWPCPCPCIHAHAHVHAHVHVPLIHTTHPHDQSTPTLHTNHSHHWYATIKIHTIVHINHTHPSFTPLIHKSTLTPHTTDSHHWSTPLTHYSCIRRICNVFAKMYTCISHDNTCIEGQRWKYVYLVYLALYLCVSWRVGAIHVNTYKYTANTHEGHCRQRIRIAHEK